MNILNLAAIIGDVPLNIVQHHTKVLDKLNSLLPEEHHFQSDHDGADILEWFKYLPEEYQKAVEQTTVLSTIELNIAISDLTTYRESEAYRLKKKDELPNSMAAAAVSTMLLIALGFVTIFVFKVMAGGDKVNGVIYDFLVKLLGWLGWILPKL